MPLQPVFQFKGAGRGPTAEVCCVGERADLYRTVSGPGRAPSVIWLRSGGREGLHIIESPFGAACDEKTGCGGQMTSYCFKPALQRLQRGHFAGHQHYQSVNRKPCRLSQVFCSLFFLEGGTNTAVPDLPKNDIRESQTSPSCVAS